MRSDDQSLHIYQNADNIVQISSEELFKINLAMDGRAVVRHLSVFPNQCNSIHITCLGCPVPQSLQFLLCLGKERDLWSLLPVIHADGNDLGQAIGTEEQPGVVRAALGQVEQGVADGRCGFTGNVTPWHTLRQDWHQIRQNFPGCKLEERQASQVQIFLIPPILPHQGAECSHHTLVASYLHYIPTVQVKLHPHYTGQPVTYLMHIPLIAHVLDWTHEVCASCRLPLPF